MKISYKMFEVLLSFVIILQRNFLKSDVQPNSKVFHDRNNNKE